VKEPPGEYRKIGALEGVSELRGSAEAGPMLAMAAKNHAA